MIQPSKGAFVNRDINLLSLAIWAMKWFREETGSYMLPTIIDGVHAAIVTNTTNDASEVAPSVSSAPSHHFSFLCLISNSFCHPYHRRHRYCQYPPALPPPLPRYTTSLSDSDSSMPQGDEYIFYPIIIWHIPQTKKCWRIRLAICVLLLSECTPVTWFDITARWWLSMHSQ